FFFQAEDGIRDFHVTRVQTCALPIYFKDKQTLFDAVIARRAGVTSSARMQALDAYEEACKGKPTVEGALRAFLDTDLDLYSQGEIGRASCRERVQISVGAVAVRERY